jgi:hypothetical protein
MLARLRGRKRAPAASPVVVVEPVISYGPDPRGWRMFAGLTAANHHFLTDQRPVLDAGVGHFDGWVAPLQTMRGMANIGQGRPVLPAGSSLDQEKTSTLTDPATAIFARRLARRQS